MASKEIEIKGKTFFEKIQRLSRPFLNEKQEFEALMFSLGVVKDESMQPKTSSLHLWLMAYEFSETIMILTKNKVVFLTSKRKKLLLENMEKPKDCESFDLEVILREANQEKQNENFDQLIKAALGDLSTVKGPIGTFV